MNSPHMPDNTTSAGDIREKLALHIAWHFAVLVSGDNQPHMSGDPRARIRGEKRRRFDEACYDAADEAIKLLSPPERSDAQVPNPNRKGLEWDSSMLVFNDRDIGEYFQCERGWRYSMMDEMPSTAYRTFKEARTALESAAKLWLGIEGEPTATQNSGGE